ncbi:MAG: hypothetical protein R3D05_22030 [Dongiaceae bacterium]
MSRPRRIAKPARQKWILEQLRASNDLWIPGMVSALDSDRPIHALDRVERRADASSASLTSTDPEWLPNVEQRQKMTALALDCVRPHMVVMIDGDGVVLDLAWRMATDGPEITVITNNLPAARLLGGNASITVHFCPGRYDCRRGAAEGAETIDFLQRYRANLAFISACGISADGPNGARADAAATKRVMLERSDQRILLLDHGKFGLRRPHSICSLGLIDRLICDEAPDEELHAALRLNGVEVRT